MMRSSVLLFLVATLIWSASESAIAPPVLPDLEVGRYRCIEKKTGKELWTAEWTITRSSDESVFECVETGEGVPAKCSEKIDWIAETVVDFSVGVRTRYSHRKNYGIEGELLDQYSKTFDFSSQVAEFEKKDAVDAQVRRSDYRFSGDILGNEFLGHFLAGLPFETESETEFHLLTSEPKLYRVKVKFLGEEEITVPAGVFKCFKTELVPQLGLLGSIVRRFIPKTYLWHTVSYPHTWVQYEGLESGLKTPHVLMQLTGLRRPETPERDQGGE